MFYIVFLEHINIRERLNSTFDLYEISYRIKKLQLSLENFSFVVPVYLGHHDGEDYGKEKSATTLIKNINLLLVG